MKLTLTLLAGMLVAGCELPNKGPDGYEFGQKEFTNTNINIQFVVHHSYAELHESAKEHGVKNYQKVRAFSALHRPDFSKCTVHIIDPDVHYAPEYIGHEIAHCMYGRWHGDTKKLREKESPSAIVHTADKKN